MKPIVGIAGNEITNPDEYVKGMPINYTPHDFVNATLRADGLPVIIPITDKSLAKQYVEGIDALILAGGQDVSPKLYGETPIELVKTTSVRRDEFEIALINEAHAQNKPIFGVCRGMQILNVAFGGTLYQDISDIQELNHFQETDISQPTHQILVERSSSFYPILGHELNVNSYHHQAVKRLAPTFKVTARSVDGFIEGMESADPKDRIMAVQWHPEFMSGRFANMQQLFDYFVKHI